MTSSSSPFSSQRKAKIPPVTLLASICWHPGTFFFHRPSCRKLYSAASALQLLKHVEEQESLEDVEGPSDVSEGSKVIHRTMTSINKVLY